MIAGAMNRYAAFTSDPAFRLIPPLGRPGRLTPLLRGETLLILPSLRSRKNSSCLLDGNVSNVLLLGDDAVS
jgi:hypothetical protein